MSSMVLGGNCPLTIKMRTGFGTDAEARPYDGRNVPADQPVPTRCLLVCADGSCHRPKERAHADVRAWNSSSCTAQPTSLPTPNWSYINMVAKCQDEVYRRLPSLHQCRRPTRDCADAAASRRRPATARCSPATPQPRLACRRAKEKRDWDRRPRTTGHPARLLQDWSDHWGSDCTADAAADGFTVAAASGIPTPQPHERAYCWRCCAPA